MFKHKPGIYTHKEMDLCYKQGFRDGFKEGSGAKKDTMPLLESEKELSTTEIKNNRELFVLCTDKWDDLTEDEKNKWRKKAEKDDLNGYTLFMKECYEKKEKC